MEMKNEKLGEKNKMNRQLEMSKNPVRHIDILMERLRSFDEVQVCELLDITTSDLLSRFHDRVLERQDYLESEVELLHEDIEPNEDWPSEEVSEELPIEDIDEWN